MNEINGLLSAQNARQGFTVQDDGAIAIPTVGRVAIGGMTLEEAQSALFQNLVQSQIDPNFNLEITEFNSQRVAVGGAVAAPNWCRLR
nr:polysaccharide biosynthesis/export family protein [Marinicella sp. W31]MDC2875808.1 polysaccharide biosynthesis/export family protein [Marinicella sp. W31]